MSDFGIFWAHYPRRVAKKDAQKAWNKLTAAQKRAAMEALPAHIKSWDDPTFIPYPASWLNGERWEDEIQEKPKAKVLQLAWWASEDGVHAKASELGLYARPGESWADFKGRIVTAAKEAA